MFGKMRTSVQLISLLTLLFIILGCKHEYPPFADYEVVGFAPVDSVMYGMLFVDGECLFALYDTTGAYNRWSMLREYDLQDPTNLILQNTQSLYLPPNSTFKNYQDSLVFFQASYYNYVILNLNAYEFHTLHFEYNVLDIAHKEHFLFVSTYEGLRVLDISNLPDYVEVFNDSINRYGAFLILRDTVLIDIHHFSGNYRAKIWNVKNPENPQIIYEVELPNIHSLTDIALSNQYIIMFDPYTIYRYNHHMYDSLVYEDMLYLNQNYSSQRTSDLHIILAYGDHIELIGITDFSTQQISISGDWYYQILSLEIFEETIYLLVRKQGIYVLQRRES